MFGSKSSSAAEVTVIGKGAVIEGTMRAQGRVQLDGKVEGALLVQGHVSVGPSGAVSGEVVADELVVGGKLEGKVSARTHLHIVSGGHVQGQVRYGTLQVDRGGVLDGTSTHGEGEAEAVPVASQALDAARVPPPPPLPTQVRAPAAAT